MAGKVRKIINLEPLGYSEKARLSWLKKEYSYIESSWNDLHNDHWSDATAIIVRLDRFVGTEELKMFPNLETVVSATTGLDHLDLVELEKRNIRLVSLRGEYDFLKTIPSTAEHTWALLGALLKKIPDSVNSVRYGEWDRDRFRGNQLKGKKLGIVGMGRTGQKVASYADAFDMEVIYYDPYNDIAKHPRCNKIQDLFRQSDIISLHIHLNDETEGIISRSLLAQVSKGAFILNTSRAGIWDEKAIVEFLRSGKLKGVATDVLNSEMGNVKQSPIWKAQAEGLNVIITPHLGGATHEAMSACEEYMVRLV